MKARTWTLADLLDLEAFLAADRGGDETDRAARDVGWSEAFRGCDTGQPGERRRALQGWLEHRRSHASRLEGSSQALPGALAVRAFRWAVAAGLLLSGIAGAAAAWGLLRYTGERLINITAYLALLVGLQLVLALVTLVLAAAARFTRLPLQGPATSLFAAAWGLLSRRLQRGRADRAEAFLRGLGSSHELSGAAWRDAAFAAAQACGVAFNIGVLAATVFKVAFYDLAFGWATTLRIAPETVHGWVQALSTPWQLLPGEHTATLSLEQIAGSRIVLKEGLASIATADVTAWWPFAVMAVAVYGLLPRLMFGVAGWAALQVRLRRLTFRHAACEGLLLTLQDRRVRVHADAEAEGEPETAPSGEAPLLSAPGTLRLLIPEELSSDAHAEPLRQAVSQALGIPVGPPEQEQIASEAGAVDGVVLVREAWRPPIEEELDTVRAWREALGATVPIRVALVGLPDASAASGFETPRQDDRDVWMAGLARLGDSGVAAVSVGSAS